MNEEIDLNFVISDQEITPFMMACFLGNLTVVHLLARNGKLEKRKQDLNGYNSFHYATMGGNN
eukprot:CAMPEP_0116873132 /NCGR_PEP_ID=MMETSP0463-20121206/4128_1 /TAXON_ID=181622 /ORGANISM="Strombidinopsis sp, Strain SopsisLIS2011" /LENGTH=62 /DNA_ID=CAMNT_0004514539 /DNA_START=210 /DNA_END=398 /DNA_ORIENTATION=-